MVSVVILSAGYSEISLVADAFDDYYYLASNTIELHFLFRV